MARTDDDVTGSAAAFVPARPTLPKLRAAAAGCRGCHLYRDATQTVFGEGSSRANVMLIGEEPGDREDREGKPFVGPAGRVLDEALAAAGIDRRHVYVTNTIKHFSFQPRGKRRIHKKPTVEEVAACRPWLDAELAVVKPRVVVCLGATAAQTILGREFRVTQHRGEFFPSPFASIVTATVHPSSILRAPDEETRRRDMKAFVEDLRVVAAKLGG